MPNCKLITVNDLNFVVSAYCSDMIHRLFGVGLLSLDKERSERITIEQYNQELDEAEAEFEKGEVVTYEELLKQIRKW